MTYKFKVSTNDGGGFVTATIDAPWDRRGTVHLDGDELSKTFLEDELTRNGMSPLGRIARHPDMEPMSLHYTLKKSADFDVEILEGEHQEYPEDLNNQPLLDSAMNDLHLKKKTDFRLQDRYQFQGMPISIENKAGSKREGKDPDGHAWSITMRNDYGYIRGTIGEDGEGVDCYIGPDRSAKHVYIVKQHAIEKVKAWKDDTCPDCHEHPHHCACSAYFDEDKVFIGFPNQQAARDAYLAHYDDDRFLGPISTMKVEDFRYLLFGNKHRAKEHKVEIPLQFVMDGAGKVRDLVLKVATHDHDGYNALRKMLETISKYTHDGAGTNVVVSKQGDDKVEFYLDGDGAGKVSLLDSASDETAIDQHAFSHFLSGISPEAMQELHVELTDILDSAGEESPAIQKIMAATSVDELEAAFLEAVAPPVDIEKLTAEAESIIYPQGVPVDEPTGLVKQLVDAVTARDFTVLQTLLAHPKGVNTHLKRGFTKLTGIRLPASKAKIDQALQEFTGIELQAQGDSEAADEAIEFGLKASGVKTREHLNAQAAAIVERIKASDWNADSLTLEDRKTLVQYSGRGGLTVNSQYEYFTPTHVAEGVWDMLKANGFENGNVLEPATGSGVFSATKNDGVRITGTEIDPLSAGVNRILHPEDQILNQSFEKLAVDAQDDTFDAIIGNVPFGDARGASAHDDPLYKKEKLIERYFVRRVVDKVRPGGLIALVVPINIVSGRGAKWERWRTQLSKVAEFLGAHKLPSKTFGRQGTDVVTDVIILRKHSRDAIARIQDMSIDTLKAANVVWDTFIQGEWFKSPEGRPFIQGTFVPKDPNKFRDQDRVINNEITEAGLKQALARKFDSRIDWALLDTAEPVIRYYAEGDRRYMNDREYIMSGGDWQEVDHGLDNPTGIDVKTYGADSIEQLKGLLSHNQSTLNLTYQQAKAASDSWPDLFTDQQKAAIALAAEQAPSAQEQVFRGALIGTLINRYQNQERTGDADTGDLVALQELVAAEYNRYGDPKKNRHLQLEGDSARYLGVFRNSIDQDGNFSALLSGESASDQQQYDDTLLQSIIEHLYIREGIDEITLEDVQALYRGPRALKSLGDLAEEPGVAITADGRMMPMNRFCSGEVFPKAAALAKAMSQESDPRLKAKWQAQIDEISAKVNSTSLEDISFGLNQKWFDRKYILEFFEQKGYRHLRYGVEKDVQREDPDTGEKYWEKELTNDTSSPFGEFYGYMDETGFLKQMNRYLNGNAITSSKAEYIQEYKDRVKALEEEFTIFMQQHQDAEQLQAQYNQKFNGYIPMSYEENSLELKGVPDTIKPHGYQNAGIRRMSEEGRGILADDVGLGKTFSAIALATYNKQMGRANRTATVVPNNVLGNWYHEHNTFLGTMEDVLFIGFSPKAGKDGNVERELVLDEEGNPKKNKFTGELMYQDVLVEDDAQTIYDKMHQIPHTSKSKIVMSQERFGMIPMRARTKEKYADKWVERDLISQRDAVEAIAGEKVDMGKGGDRLSYNEAKRTDKVRQAYSDEGTNKKGEYPYFEDMNFQSVIVDEAHHFKNSYEAGKESQRIAYLPTPVSSQRARDMAMKMAHLRDQNAGRGPVLLTATPITNSPLEIYNMLSLLIPVEEFERYGVYTADDFVRVFGKVETVTRQKVSGELVDSDGLVGFQNLDGLRNLFHRYTLLRNADDVGLELPDAPESNEFVDMSDEQEELYEQLRELAKEAAKPRSQQKGKQISMFSVIRDMDRVTTDMDLYNHTMTFRVPAKYRANLEKLLTEVPKTVKVKIYDEEEGKNVNSTVEFDYTLDAQADPMTLVVPEAFEDAIVSRMPGVSIELSEVSHPLTPKYAKLMQKLLSEHESGGKQIIFTEEKSQHEKIARLLVHHLPIDRKEIGIINGEAAKGKKLQKISDAYNRGSLKIVICNKKAEVGVNLQKGTTAIHHLTLPWTPASIQQRNGRGVRQGNTAKRVSLYYYMGKGSFDEFRLNLLKQKSNWMRDILNGKDVEASNANAFAADDYLDMLESDPEAAKARRLEKLAQQQAEKRRKQDNATINQFSQLSYAVRQLESLEADKDAEHATLTERQQRRRASLERIRQKAKDEPDDAELQKKVEDAEYSLSTTERALSALDAKWDEIRDNLESKIKQRRGYLEAKARQNELPFSEALINNPLNAITRNIGNTASVVHEGQYLERRNADGSSNILRIKSVDLEERKITVEAVIGRFHYGRNEQSVDIALLQEDLIPVELSDEDIQVRQMLSTPMEYANLAEYDKDLLITHKSEIKLASYGGYLFRDSAGKLIAAQGDAHDINQLVLPDPSDENLRKELALMYLDMTRSNDPSIWTLTKVMPVFFGSMWREEVANYGTKLTAAEITEKAAAYWDAFSKEPEMQTYNGTTGDEALYTRFIQERRHIQNEIENMLYAVGDNHQDISLVTRQYLDSVFAELELRRNEAKAERIRQTEEDLRNDPDFKEVPGHISEAFKRLGLAVRYNSAELTIAGRGRYRRSKTLSKFGYLFLQDDYGKSGTLFRNKELLKSQYGAQFCCDQEGFSGAWWYVPAHVDLQRLYELLS